MSHGRALAATTLFLAAGAACSGSNTDGGINDPGATDVGIPAEAGVSFPDASLLRPDVEVIVPHDGGGPETCATTCDCPQGLGCVNNECRILANPVYCCEKANCPSGQVCLDSMERPANCPGLPDAGPDAGGSSDLGAGYVGAYCEGDSDCTQVPGMTCWTRNEPPYFWNYCTVSPCLEDTDCPARSHCLGLRLGMCNTQSDCPAGTECLGFECVVNGCLGECGSEADCRSDAFCLFVANLGYSICLPDCRDDVLDCLPRDGSVYCNRSSGRCEPLAMQSSTAVVGDACGSNADCGDGDVCLSNVVAYTFPGGLCSRVCDVLPEATSCDTNTDRCQNYLGIGMCFRDCVNGSCPNRPNAMCTELNANWVVSSCVPL